MIRKKLLDYANEMEKKSRAFKNFKRGINSKATICDYTDYLKRFMTFHKIEDQYDEVVTFDTKKIDNLISDYLDSLIDRKLKGISQRAHLMGIERLFIMNDCIWHKDRIRKSITKDDEIPGGNIPITNHEIHMLLQCTKSLRTKAFVHFLATTGARPAGITDPVLRLKHLVEMNYENKKCYAMKIYDGSKYGYWSFFTPESTSVLDQWIDSRKNKGEEITVESPLFTTVKKTNTKNQHLTEDNARYIIYDLIKISGMKREKISTRRYDKSVMYMFRKRFNTILKLNNDVNSNIAEKLMAHKKGLDGTYLQPTREECFAEFVKAISDLTIDPTERQKIEIAKKQQKIKELEAKAHTIDEQEQRIKQLEGEEENKESILVTLQQKIQTMEQNQSDEQKRFEQWYRFMQE